MIRNSSEKFKEKEKNQKILKKLKNLRNLKIPKNKRNLKTVPNFKLAADRKLSSPGVNFNETLG